MHRMLLLTQSSEIARWAARAAVFTGLAGVNWRNVLTIVIAVVDYSLLVCHEIYGPLGPFIPTIFDPPWSPTG